MTDLRLDKPFIFSSNHYVWSNKLNGLLRYLHNITSYAESVIHLSPICDKLPKPVEEIIQREKTETKQIIKEIIDDENYEVKTRKYNISKKKYKTYKKKPIKYDKCSFVLEMYEEDSSYSSEDSYYTYSSEDEYANDY